LQHGGVLAACGKKEEGEWGERASPSRQSKQQPAGNASPACERVM